MKNFIAYIAILFCLFGCGESSDSQIFSTTSKKNEKALELYIDRATLPTIQQISKIVYEKSNNKKMIFWSRYQISDQKLLNAINAENFTHSNQFMSKLEEEITNEKYTKIIINGNTIWAEDSLKVLALIKRLGLNLDINLNFYDDGSLEYVYLYEFSKLPLNEQLHRIEMGIYDVEKTINRGEAFSHNIEKIYSISSLYRTKFYLLRKDIFKTDLNLSSLYNRYNSNFEQMRWDYFSSFDNEQKELFLKLTKFEPNKIKKEYNKSPNKNFIFIGSNIATASAKQQIDIINEAKNEYSNILKNNIYGYDLFFKGHPSATFNTEIVNACDMTKINNKIPFEVLTMTDTLPDAVGGMGSSVFFSLPNDVEKKFIIYKDGTDINNNPLIQVMLKLKIISERNIYLINEITG